MAGRRVAVEEVLHVLVNERVTRQRGRERGALRLGRQLAVDQQVAGLDEVALLGELFDRIAAVAQDALLTVEVRDGARRGAGVHVPAVERDVPGLPTQRAN